MKILIYGINFSPELTGIGKYTGEMAAWLAEKGHTVKVLTAPPYYPDWQVHRGYRSYWYACTHDQNLSVIRCPMYVPKQPTALKRILHLASFALSSLPPLLKQVFWRPDRIILVAPTLICAPGAIALAKLTGAASVVHVQDYEVDALFGLGMVKAGVISKVAHSIECFLLNAFDRVSTISSGMLNRATQKGIEKDSIIFFPNWSETERFERAKYSDELLTRLGVPAGQKVILYAGNIGEKQGLDIIIDAAKVMQQRDMVFLIVGEGAGKSRLQAQVRKAGLSNIVFAPLQPYEDLPKLLASASCHLVIERRGAADAVLPSKLTNILAVSGNAVITADADTSLGRLCIEHPGISVCVEPESSTALVAGIERALSMPFPNRIAGDYARKYLAKDPILSEFVSELVRIK